MKIENDLDKLSLVCYDLTVKVIVAAFYGEMAELV